MNLTATLVATVALASPGLASDISDTLLRAGLAPNALAAAGVQASKMTDIVEDVEAYLDANSTTLSSADADYVAAKKEVDRLRRLVRSGSAGAQDISDLATAKQDQSAATSDRDSALDALFAAGTANLTAGAVSTLSTIRTNRGWSLPIEFLAKERGEQAWIDLRDALINEKVNQQEGIAVETGCAQLLLAERADADVSAAKTAFDTNIAAVTSSWDSAVAGS